VDPTQQAINVLQAATVLLLSPLLAGVSARFKAWTESRRGPSIFQPYFDLAKYLRKETVVPKARRGSSSWLRSLRLGPTC